MKVQAEISFYPLREPDVAEAIHEFTRCVRSMPRGRSIGGVAGQRQLQMMLAAQNLL